MKADRPSEEGTGSRAAEHFAELLARAAVKRSDGQAQKQVEREARDA